jgi:plastocyanin
MRTLLSLVGPALILVACGAPSPVPPTLQPTATPVVPTAVPTQRVSADVRVSATAPGQQSAAAPEVDILDDLYLPAQITVRAGQSITFRNYGAKVHDVVSRSNDWPSPLIQPGDRTRIAFSRPGRFEYTCSFHSSMGGVVIVE